MAVGIEREIKRNRESSYRAILINYGLSRLFGSIPFILSVCLTIVAFVAALCYGLDVYKFNEHLINSALSIFPSLLGFSLGGFAIIVSFNNKEFLEKISKNVVDLEKGKVSPSLFQKVIAVFAYGIIIQALSLLISFFLKYSYEFLFHISLELEKDILDVGNFSAFILLTFFLSYSLLLVPYIVKNVYGFGQITHPIKLDYVNRKKD